MSRKGVFVFTGTSVDGCGVYDCWPFQYFGVTSYSDCGKPDWQSSATYYPDGNTLFRNMAISATNFNTNGYPDLVPLTPVKLDTIIANKAPGRAYVIGTAIGTNDLAVGTYGDPVLFANAVGAWCKARKLAGWDYVWIATLLPKSTMLEANRSAYNSRVKDPTFMADNLIDFYVDNAATTIVGDYANLTNATYYNQQTPIQHPTAAGHALIAAGDCKIKFDALRASL